MYSPSNLSVEDVYHFTGFELFTWFLAIEKGHLSGLLMLHLIGSVYYNHVDARTNALFCFFFFFFFNAELAGNMAVCIYSGFASG